MADISKDDDEVVLERIMANGTFDELRKQLLEDLRTDVRRNTLLHACDFCAYIVAPVIFMASCPVAAVTGTVPHDHMSEPCICLLHMLPHL
jgi:hypothetical protein